MKFFTSAFGKMGEDNTKFVFNEIKTTVETTETESIKGDSDVLSAGDIDSALNQVVDALSLDKEVFGHLDDNKDGKNDEWVAEFRALLPENQEVKISEFEEKLEAFLQTKIEEEHTEADLNDVDVDINVRDITKETKTIHELTPAAPITTEDKVKMLGLGKGFNDPLLSYMSGEEVEGDDKSKRQKLYFSGDGRIVQSGKELTWEETEQLMLNEGVNPAEINQEKFSLKEQTKNDLNLIAQKFSGPDEIYDVIGKTYGMLANNENRPPADWESVINASGFTKDDAKKLWDYVTNGFPEGGDENYTMKEVRDGNADVPVSDGIKEQQQFLASLHNLLENTSTMNSSANKGADGANGYATIMSRRKFANMLGSAKDYIGGISAVPESESSTETVRKIETSVDSGLDTLIKADDLVVYIDTSESMGDNVRDMYSYLVDNVDLSQDKLKLIPITGVGAEANLENGFDLAYQKALEMSAKGSPEDKKQILILTDELQQKTENKDIPNDVEITMGFFDPRMRGDLKLLKQTTEEGFDKKYVKSGAQQTGKDADVYDQSNAPVIKMGDLRETGKEDPLSGASRALSSMQKNISDLVGNEALQKAGLEVRMKSIQRIQGEAIESGSSELMGILNAYIRGTQDVINKKAEEAGSDLRLEVRGK